MSLFFCGVLFFGVVLGGLILLVIYSLLTMAQKGDKFQEQLELEEPRDQEYARSVIIRGKSENLGVPAASDVYYDGTDQTRICIRG
jgi:hypothetical protein